MSVLLNSFAFIREEGTFVNNRRLKKSTLSTFHVLILVDTYVILAVCNVH